MDTHQERWQLERELCDEEIRACEKQLSDLKSKRASLAERVEPNTLVEWAESSENLEAPITQQQDQTQQTQADEMLFKSPKELSGLKSEGITLLVFGVFFFLLFLSAFGIFISHEVYEPAFLMGMSSLFPLYHLLDGARKWSKAHRLHKTLSWQSHQSHWKKVLKKASSKKKLCETQ